MFGSMPFFHCPRSRQLAVATATGLSALAVALVIKRRAAVQAEVMEAVLIAGAIDERLTQEDQQRSGSCPSIVNLSEIW
jgi:hypothetical protein